MYKILIADDHTLMRQGLRRSRGVFGSGQQRAAHGEPRAVSGGKILQRLAHSVVIRASYHMQRLHPQVEPAAFGPLGKPRQRLC